MKDLRVLTATSPRRPCRQPRRSEIKSRGYSQHPAEWSCQHHPQRSDRSSRFPNPKPWILLPPNPQPLNPKRKQDLQNQRAGRVWELLAVHYNLNPKP